MRQFRIRLARLIDPDGSMRMFRDRVYFKTQSLTYSEWKKATKMFPELFHKGGGN